MPQAILNSFMMPMGPVEPDDFPNMAFWWKADSFALADGTAVGGVGNEWIDQSVNGRDATQGTAGKRPLFKTNIFGSMPAIRFDGVDDALNFSLSTFANNTEFTLLIVAKAITLADAELMGHDVNNIQVRVCFPSNSQVSFFAGTISVNSTAFSNALTNVNLISWRRILDAGNYDIHYRENKTSRGFGGPEPGPTTLNRIGETSFGGNANWDIAEIIGYHSGHLTDPQMDALYDTYFKPRWGLP